MRAVNCARDQATTRGSAGEEASAERTHRWCRIRASTAATFAVWVPAGSIVNAALRLGRACPASGPSVLARLDAAGARSASDRSVAVEEQRVDQHAVLSDIGLDVVLCPLSDGVELHHRASCVPLHDPHVLAAGGLVAAQP